ncbi:hypothetical protein [Bradyrhizobium sp.]|uniref:hypothetical protein n=1 Tax=Bradyrhizobium sp. TaxID=376 RepID=UPI0025C339BB|nr:hypothetical protein [Bradyrhizobium sp.]
MSDNLEALRALRGPGRGKPRVLENASFVNTELSIAIGPGDPPDAPVRVRNCSFSHCTAVVHVMPGVELEGVVLDNVESPDSMTIATQTVLREVIVKGSPMIGGLWVKPILADRAVGDDPLTQRLRRCAQWAVAASQSTEWMLDFSEFDAPHTEVVGLPLSKLKWNRERHVALRLERTASELERWRRLDLPVTSFWTLCMGRLKSFGATEGVFLMPLQWTKRYAQANEEKMQLMDAGFLVSPE